VGVKTFRTRVRRVARRYRRVCAALLADLPTRWTAVGAVCFAGSDGMIGTGQFVLESHALQVPIWWVYAMSQVLITAGFFFGRATRD